MAQHVPPVRYGWYGDDFTGATDTLAILAEAGWSAMLFTRVPSQDDLIAAGPLDAIGIAGNARTLSPAAMREHLSPVASYFKESGSPIVHYKCCSTFDSSPTVGSLGEAYRIFAPLFNPTFVPIVGGQPNIGRYCAFSTIFASAGLNRPVHRLDRHPTMAHHPVTPMTEADLRLHLAKQELDTVAGYHLPHYDRSPTEQQAALDTLLADGPGAVLFDIASVDHLRSVGVLILEQARRSQVFAIGPSSVAQAVLAASDAMPVRFAPQVPTRDGPVFVLAGSLSPVTRRQVAAATSYTHIAADIGAWIADPVPIQRQEAEVIALLRSGRNVLLVTGGDGAHTGVGHGDVAALTADFVANVTRAVKLRRLGVAGGDTSSLAAQALPVSGFSYAKTLSPGVTLCCAHSRSADLDGLTVMFKGGQMGPDDIFEILLEDS